MKKSNLLLISILLVLLIVSCCKPASLQHINANNVAMSDGTHVFYKVYGKNEPAIVFVHGFGCDMNAWSEQFNYFSDKSMVVFIDIPGYGLSDKPHTDYTLDFYAESVKTVLDSLAIHNAILVGHSLGTAICRQVYFNYPKTTRKIIDVDGVYCFFPSDSTARAENKRQYAAFVSVFAGNDIKESMKEFIEPLFIDNTSQSVRDYAMSTMLQTPGYVAYNTMNNLVQEKYWTGEVIDIPSLIIASKNSFIPDNYEQIMAMLYTNMSYHAMDSVGHFIMMEQPDTFNKMLYDFIKE